MWVLFAPDAGTDPLWQTLEENEFFELQAYKPATSSKNETSLLSMLTALPSSLLATSRAPSLIGGGTEENFPYRILLKTQPPYGQRHAAKQQSKEAKDSGSVELSSVADSSHGGSRAPAQVIALAKDLRVIKEHWNWLVNDMSTACSFFTRESEKEENELWDFLLMKFTSMAQQEAKKREMQREREREKAMERERQLEIATFVDNKHKYAKKQANIMINEEEEEDNKAKEKRFEEMDQSRQALWKKLFPKISTIERLIVEYPCSLERKGVERRGLLLVTPRHVCFHSPRLNTRVAIYWRVITSLSRATAVNGTVPAIYVTCLGAYHEEFLFHSLADFEQTMGLLVRIWHMALLEEAADRDGDEEAKARLMGITREQLLCEIEREKHRKTFRMPKEELLIAEFCGSLWMENIIQVYEGTLHISANYVCFHADVEGHSFSVVIPFREVLDIISVDSKLIQVNTQSNKFSFSLLWRRQHCCELMVQLWSRRIRSSERLLEKVPPAEGPWDDFGFVGLGPIVKDSKHFRSDYAIKQKLQRKRWEEYIGKYGWGIQMLKTSDALRDIVRYGIPDELKGGLWQIFLGSAHSFCIKPGEYQNLLKQFDGKNSDAISEIERDVNRSFPEHPYFQSESGKQALRNVLIAYSWRNPSLGYCQSMNIICSLLLLFMGEEETFWALTILCEELFPQYFTPDMLGSMTDQHVLEDLVAEHFPKLNAHLESIQLPLVLISFPWFMCLFIGYIPMQTSIRILDILFCEGYDSTFMFKVALAVFKFNQKFILNTKDFSKLVIQLKFTNLDCDTLLEITEDFWWVTSKLINEMRDYHRFQLLKESKTPAPPIASPSGTPLSARSTSAPTHFPRAPSTPVQTPTPTPSSSPPLPTYMTMPIRTRSDSSLFATAKTPLGPMSIPEGTTGSLTTIPFLTSADMSGVGSPSSQPPMSAPPGYIVKTPSPSPTPRKVQFDGTSIPFVGGAADNKIMSALTRLSSKERLSRAEEDESTSTDATGSDDDESTSSMDDSSDTDSSDDDTVSSETVSETERVTDPVPAGREASDEAGKEESRSARRRKAKREQEEAEREQLFHLELDPKPTAAGGTAEPDSSGTAQAADAGENGQSGDGVVPAASGAKTPVDEAARLAGGSKSEPSTPIRVTHSDDVLDANDAEKEKRRKRKIKSRRRRLASLGRTRSRKSRERVGNRLKGDVNADDSGDVFEPEPDDDDEREKRIVRLDLDLNLAWRKSAAEDRAGADGNKGVKYLQRFLFKKRRRHSDGYLDIIKEDDASLVSPRTRTGADDSGEPSVTHRRFFVEEDEGEERETTFGEPDALDSARREKGKERETVIERRRSQTDTTFSPRHRPGEHEAAPVVASSSSSGDLRATESLSTSALSRTTEGLFASSSSSGVRAASGRTQQQQRPSQQPTTHDNSGGERKDKEKEEEEQSEDESSSETDESERDDELKSSIFVTSNTTHLPRVRKTKKVRERRASVANLLKKEPSGRLLDHAGAFVERKRAEQLEEDFLIRTAGAAVAAAAGKRSDEMSPVHSLKAMDRVDSKPSGLALEQSHTTPLKRSKEAVDYISAAAAGDLAPAVVMKATVTPGGRSPPMLPKIEELREDLTSSADEDSGSDGDLAGRELGTSPEGRRKKIRSKLRNSRRLSLSEPNLNLATSPQSHHPHHHHQRGRSNSKAAARQAQQAASELKRSDEEEWERTSDDELSARHRRGASNGGGDRSGGDSDDDGSDSDRGSDDDGSSRSSLDYGQSSSGGGGGGHHHHHQRRSEDGERPEGGSGRRRAKFFKYSADILAKTKGAGGRDKDRDRDRDRGERDDRKRIEEQRRRDKDRTKEEEREKRKKERMDEKEARRRSKEDKERRKVLSGGGDHGDHHHHKEKEKEKEREKERERDGLDDSDKKRRHKEEKEMKRRKEEEEKESRRKRKEEEKELKKQHKLEKRKDASPSEVDERGGDGGAGGGGGSDIVGKQDKQHKKAFGLLPLPHLHHGHSLSFHLPSSPRRNAGGGGSSAASNGMLKTPPSPRAHIAPITFNRTTPHPQAQEGSPRKPPPAPASTSSSRDAMTSSDDSLTQ